MIVCDKVFSDAIRRNSTSFVDGRPQVSPFDGKQRQTQFCASLITKPSRCILDSDSDNSVTDSKTPLEHQMCIEQGVLFLHLRKGG